VPALATASTTNELVRFLLARFDEDDARLKRRSRAQDSGVEPDAAPDVWSVGRLRTESLARRRIVGTIQQLLVLRDQPCEKPVRDGAVQVLRSLAAPYSAHTGFRPEWKTSSRY
jgi:hypothetical protein